MKSTNRDRELAINIVDAIGCDDTARLAAIELWTNRIVEHIIPEWTQLHSELDAQRKLIRELRVTGQKLHDWMEDHGCVPPCLTEWEKVS